MPWSSHKSYFYHVSVGANHGKESGKAPEEEASVNNNGTDGEQVSLDDGKYTNRLQ